MVHLVFWKQDQKIGGKHKSDNDIQSIFAGKSLIPQEKNLGKCKTEIRAQITLAIITCIC